MVEPDENNASGLPAAMRLLHYEVQRKPDGSPMELGRGGMGVTYKATDTNLDCDVAIKVIHPGQLGSAEVTERFLREARSAARLRHRNVAAVYNLGESEEDGSYFYVMEFVDGETVEDVVQRDGRIGLERALDIAAQVASALVAAESKQLLHRDIKLSNIMLTREADGPELAKLIDFGLAKNLAKVGGMGKERAVLPSTTKGFLGTPLFASPEQIMEREVDIRSDIYSLGVSLWYMLVGSPPFVGGTAEVMNLHIHEEPPFKELKGVPGPVVAIIRKMLQKNPDDRYLTARELRRVLTAPRLNGSLPHVPDNLRNIPAVSKLGTSTMHERFAAAAEKPRVSPPQPKRNWRGTVLAAATLIVAVVGLSTWLVVARPWKADPSTAGAEIAQPVEEPSDPDQPFGTEAPPEAVADPVAEPAVPGEVRTFAGIPMVWCPPTGEEGFLMGNPADEDGPERAHSVVLSEGFWLAKTELTRAQWAEITGGEGPPDEASRLPVGSLSWDEAQEFVGMMNDQRPVAEGWTWSLPTEAQWEYAYLAGQRADADEPTPDTANIAGVDGTLMSGAKAVGSFAPNAWMLDDMDGNVREWCSDWYGAGSFTDGTVDPRGPGSGDYRVTRGGSWLGGPRLARSHYRGKSAPDYRAENLGLRLALVPASDTHQP